MLKSLLVYKLDEHATIILVYMLRLNCGVITSFVSVISAYADVKEVN